jgi:hypothetical protein
MARGSARKRRPTEADLSAGQREIYEALPEHLRANYLKGLPDIAISDAGRRKKVLLIEERLALVDGVIVSYQAQKKHLTQLLRTLNRGGSPAGIDLRQELKPPAIEGVAIRYVRPKNEKEPAAPG